MAFDLDNEELKATRKMHGQDDGLYEDKMNRENKFYLFKDDIVIKASSDIEELKQDIVKMKLHINTAPYYCNLNSVEDLEEFADVHEGVYFPVCNFLNDKNEIVDVFIVRDFYAYQDKKWQKEIERFIKNGDVINE